MWNRVFLLAVFLGLTACSDSKPPEKTVFDAQMQALKKAREVESTLQQNAEKQREGIERSESGAEEKPASPTQSGY